MISLTILLPLLWLGLGTVFMMIAFTDKAERQEGERAVARPRALPNPTEHPLGHVHLALVTSRMARRRERERAEAETAKATAGAEEGTPPPRAGPPRRDRAGSHLRRVV
jgi:hypothetical protein